MNTKKSIKNKPSSSCQETPFMIHLRTVAKEVEKWPDWMKGEYVNVKVDQTRVKKKNSKS